jgi:hypothetical protein
LQRAGIEVTTTSEAGLRATDDKTQLEFARAAGRVIVTRDRDFLRIADAEPDHPGIAFYKASLSIREIIDGLVLIYEVLAASEMAGHIEYL